MSGATVAGRDPAWARRWPGLVLCAAGGAVAALAHPPYGFLPGLLGFALVLTLLERRAPARPLRSGFARGWAAGAGYLAVSTSWIGEPFLIDAAERAWQAPFALALMPGLIGLMWGAAGAMYARLAPRGPARVLAFAGLFGLWEWLRGHMLTGFPWDLPGEAWRAGSAPSQAAAWVGAYGLSWITLAVAAAPAVLLDDERVRAKAAVVACAAAALVALYVGGGARLRAHPMAAEASGPRIRVVQPNLPEPARVDDALVRSMLARYVALSASPGPRADVVVWPEGAVPAAFSDYLAPGAPTRAQVEAALAPGQTLILGGVRYEPGVGRWRAFNTLLALRRGPDGLEPVATYDKHHLVPFGEYLPLAWLLAPLGLRQVVSVGQGFDAGPPPRPIDLPLAEAQARRVQPLICYEALFPSIAEAAPRAAWLVNISDDAWFGRNQGPWQHLNLASYRAIEEGLPMVRATPTGVSAVVDGLGRTLRGPDRERRLLAPGREGVIDARLPAALAPTPFSRWRDAPFWLLTVGGLGLAALSRRPRLEGKSA